MKVSLKLPITRLYEHKFEYSIRNTREVACVRENDTGILCDLLLFDGISDRPIHFAVEWQLVDSLKRCSRIV